MDLALVFTSLLMGLAGGPHCVAMCGAACGALGGRTQGRAGGATVRVIALAVPGDPPVSQSQAARERLGVSPGQWLFQLGRLFSYAALGAVAAASMQTVGWLSVHAAALRPLWTLMHVAAALLGLVLLWQARQPVWLEQGARRLWRGLQTVVARAGGSPGSTRAAPLVMGLAWGFLPCGLLYSALLVAALSPGLWQGAVVMALFALGSSISLLAGPWLWRHLRAAGSGDWAVRLAGAALLGLSVWALWMGLVHETAPWCVTPAAQLP